MTGIQCGKDPLGGLIAQLEHPLTYLGRCPNDALRCSIHILAVNFEYPITPTNWQESINPSIPCRLMHTMSNTSTAPYNLSRPFTAAEQVSLDRSLPLGARNELVELQMAQHRAQAMGLTALARNGRSASTRIAEIR